MAEHAAAADTLRVGGTGTAAEMLRRVGAGFANETGVKIEVVPSLGSGGALRALADNKLGIAVSARPLTEKERASGLKQVLVLRTAFVFATSKGNPNGLKSSDIPRIYADAKATWSDGKPLRIILRPRGESDVALMGRMFAGMDAAIEAARSRPDVPIAATDQDNVKIAERVPGSLTGTTLTQLKTERCHVHFDASTLQRTENPHLSVVPLDGIEPTLASFESGAYPYAKKFYFILGSNSAPSARRFVSYLQSPPGLKALRVTDTLPTNE